MATYDRIVVGLGGMGSAALCSLARRGAKVLGIESYGVAHDRGSSHGQTRIIRQAYFEHPDYVPLLRQAYQQWERLEAECGRRLFERVGLLEVGVETGPTMQGIRRSASTHQLPIETLTPAESARRFPSLHIPEGMDIIFEANAGFLYVERCVEAAVEVAQRYGAEVRTHTAVRQIRIEQGHCEVVTDAGVDRAEGVVLCLGPWAPAQLPIRLPLHVVRKHLHWFHCDDRRFHVDARCPAFFYELPEGSFYGFPAFEDVGVKVAEHTRGERAADPTLVDRTMDPMDTARIDGFVRACLPSVSSTRTRHEVCMYTMTPDEHFIIDRHPDNSRAVYAAGFSGHGFKFAAGMGECLADMTLHETRLPELDFLAAARFPSGNGGSD